MQHLLERGGERKRGSEGETGEEERRKGENRTDEHDKVEQCVNCIS